MHPKFLEILEFPKILDRLAEGSSFSAGRELALRLAPSSDVEEVRRRQQETTEAKGLLETRTQFSLSAAEDVRPLLRNAEIGSPLTPSELLSILDTLNCGRRVRREITSLGRRFPHLASNAKYIEECPEVVNEITRCIDRGGEVVDEASPALSDIRQNLREAHERLLKRLDSIITSPANAPFLQEPLITQRGGRYVILLKADFKGRIPGIVHDQSASGVTLFIEPLATIELNNRWRELQLEEEREIRAILKSLTACVADHSRAIEETVETLAEIDLALAKAKYSLAIQGAEPKVTPFQVSQREGAPLRLVQARHPLLTGRVVPIDIHIGDEFIALVITGPNTGGKTVALKTVGLLALMAQAGLHIPADRDSVLPVFDDVYADIGDEQSIEQSLSTFSSHIGNIIRILQSATDRSLVLLDDLGAGTDPIEGSALARAILSFLLSRRIITITTTHYPELKIYAQATPGAENASVEFDLETLSPTYRLSIGLPGQSNALAIASRLGLPQKIVAEARGWLSAEDIEAESLLAEIKAARDQAAEASATALRSQEEAQRVERELSLRLAEIEELRREIINQARQQAQIEIERAREHLEAMERRLKTRAAPQEWLAEVKAEIEGLDELTTTFRPIPELRPTSIDQLQVGDRVWVKGLQKEGRVTSILGDEVELEVGSFRVRTKLEDMGPPGQTSENEEPAEGFKLSTFPRPALGTGLDLRGLKSDEAIAQLDRYLNDAYLAGLSSVHIIHGKGTGTLRRVVCQELDEHPLVASYRPGERHEGGSGVTVAKLISRY